VRACVRACVYVDGKVLYFKNYIDVWLLHGCVITSYQYHSVYI